MKCLDGKYILIAEKDGKEVEADEDHIWAELNKAGFVWGGACVDGRGGSSSICFGKIDTPFHGSIDQYFNGKPPYIVIEGGATELEIFTKAYTPVPS